MSTILRALRRLEREKEAETVRARLRDEVVAPVAAPRRRVWPLWCSGGAVALVAGVALWWLMPLTPPAPARIEPASVSAGVSAPRAPSAPSIAAPALPASPQPPVPTPSGLVPAPVAAAPAVVPEPPAPAAKTEPRPEPARAASAEPIVRAAVPAFSLQRTVWHPRRERRVAHVALSESGEVLELREGDSLGPLRVEEITPSGVTFSQGDVRISRRVGEG